MLVDLDVTKFKVPEPLEGNELNRRLTQMVYELNEIFGEMDSRLLPAAPVTYLDDSFNVENHLTKESTDAREYYLYNIVEQIAEQEGTALPMGQVAGDILIWDGGNWVLIGNLIPGAAGEVLVSSGTAWASGDGGFAHKVEGAVAGNFAGLDGDGDLTDSGISPSDIPYIPDCPATGSHVLMCNSGVIEWVEVQAFECPTTE